MAPAAVSDQEIRTYFAQRLARRFEAMQGAAQCSCGSRNGEHLPSCAVHCWAMAARTVQMVLDEQDEDGAAVDE